MCVYSYLFIIYRESALIRAYNRYNMSEWEIFFFVCPTLQAVTAILIR